MAKLAQVPGLGLIEPLDPGLVRNDDLQDALEAQIDNPGGGQFPASLLRRQAFAVVDLSDNPSTPAYAGWNDTVPKPTASLAKLLPLYGAYQLRAHLRRLSSLLSISDLTTLANATRTYYREMGAATATLPRIEKFFTFTSTGAVNFISQPQMTDAELQTKSGTISVRLDRTVPCLSRDSHGTCTRRGRSLLPSDLSKLDFELHEIAARDQLRLMAGWSDDVAAAVVIESLGFPYLWELANRSGLFRQRGNWPSLTRHDVRPSERGGLVLTSDYNHGVWNPRPPIVPGGSSQAASARSIAWLMTMLAQDRLIDHEAGVGMREMLRKTDPHFTSNQDRGEDAEYSPIGFGFPDEWIAIQQIWDYDDDNIPDTGPQEDLAASKIGLLNGGNASNALIARLERPLAAGGSKTITVVLVGLYVKQSEDEPLINAYVAAHPLRPREDRVAEFGKALLEDFGASMAALLVTRHKLKPV
jgi:hypothetical protein